MAKVCPWLTTLGVRDGVEQGVPIGPSSTRRVGRVGTALRGDAMSMWAVGLRDALWSVGDGCDADGMLVLRRVNRRLRDEK